MSPPHIPKFSPISDEATIKAIADAVAQLQQGKAMRVDLIKWALSLVISAVIAWAVVDKRVTVLESRYEDLHSSVSEIRQDIKTLLQRTP